MGIKGHFCEVKGHIEFRTRALSTSPPSGVNILDVSSQNKLLKEFLGLLFSYGSDILTLNFPKISLNSKKQFCFLVCEKNPYILVS